MWKPIETAPKDGTEFDAWCDGERVTDVSWKDWLNAFGYYDPLGDWGEGATEVINPTHWMPLPDPPKETA